MPELPDITIYLEALAPRIVGQPLERARIASPSLLSSRKALRTQLLFLDDAFVDPRAFDHTKLAAVDDVLVHPDL